MIDEIENKLLEEIKNLSNLGYHNYKTSILEAQTRLAQHRETKKWIEGLIDKMFIPDERFRYFAEELKKQISGAE